MGRVLRFFLEPNVWEDISGAGAALYASACARQKTHTRTRSPRGAASPPFALRSAASSYLEVGGHDLEVWVHAQQVVLRELEPDVLRDEVDRDQVVAALPRNDDVRVAVAAGRFLGFGCGSRAPPSSCRREVGNVGCCRRRSRASLGEG